MLTQNEKVAPASLPRAAPAAVPAAAAAASLPRAVAPSSRPQEAAASARPAHDWNARYAAKAAEAASTGAEKTQVVHERTTKNWKKRTYSRGNNEKKANPEMCAEQKDPRNEPCSCRPKCDTHNTPWCNRAFHCRAVYVREKFGIDSEGVEYASKNARKKEISRCAQELRDRDQQVEIAARRQRSLAWLNSLDGVVAHDYTNDAMMASPARAQVATTVTPPTGAVKAVVQERTVYALSDREPIDISVLKAMSRSQRTAYKQNRIR